MFYLIKEFAAKNRKLLKYTGNACVRIGASSTSYSGANQLLNVMLNFASSGTSGCTLPNNNTLVFNLPGVYVISCRLMFGAVSGQNGVFRADCLLDGYGNIISLYGGNYGTTGYQAMDHALYIFEGINTHNLRLYLTRIRGNASNFYFDTSSHILVTRFEYQ